MQKGDDGLVRKVTLQYRLPGEKKSRTVSRPIHGIAVIVPTEEQKDEENEGHDEGTHCNADVEFRRGVEAPARSVSGLKRLDVRHSDKISVDDSPNIDNEHKNTNHLNPNAAVFTPPTSQPTEHTTQ